MKIKVFENSIETKKEFQIIDITDKVKKFILKQEVKDGEITISTMHTTTSIVVNENEKKLELDKKDRNWSCFSCSRTWC